MPAPVSVLLDPPAGEPVAAGHTITLAAQVIPAGARGSMRFYDGVNPLGAVVPHALLAAHLPGYDLDRLERQHTAEEKVEAARSLIGMVVRDGADGWKLVDNPDWRPRG